MKRIRPGATESAIASIAEPRTQGRMPEFFIKSIIHHRDAEESFEV
jgi:hypothetical protein